MEGRRPLAFMFQTMRAVAEVALRASAAAADARRALDFGGVVRLDVRAHEVLMMVLFRCLFSHS